MTLSIAEALPKPEPATEVDEEVFEHVEDLEFDVGIIASYSTQRLSDEEIVDTTIIASAEQPYSYELRRHILGSYGRGCIELFIPNILKVEAVRNRHNPSWITSSPIWDDLSASEKCSQILAHELEHRFEDSYRFGMDWETFYLAENTRKRATAITTGAMAVVGSAVAASFELFHLGLSPSTLGLDALVLAGTAYAGYRTEPVIKRRGYFNLPNEIRANQAALDSTNQFVVVQEKAK